MSDLGFALIIAALLLAAITAGFRIGKSVSKHGALEARPNSAHSSVGKEVVMRLAAIVLMLLVATLAGSEATETTTYSSSRFRTVIGTTTLSNLTLPTFFRIIAGTFWSGETSGVASADGFYYEFSGTTEIIIGSKSTTLRVGDGMFIPSGTRFTLKTADTRPPVYLQFLVSRETRAEDPDGQEGARF
jgi:hypothetical protein